MNCDKCGREIPVECDEGRYYRTTVDVWLATYLRRYGEDATGNEDSNDPKCLDGPYWVLCEGCGEEVRRAVEGQMTWWAQHAGGR